MFEKLDDESEIIACLIRVRQRTDDERIKNITIEALRHFLRYGDLLEFDMELLCVFPINFLVILLEAQFGVPDERLDRIRRLIDHKIHHKDCINSDVVKIMEHPDTFWRPSYDFTFQPGF